MDDKVFTFKILTLGEAAVGKTCLILRYIDNKFEADHLTTIGVDFRAKTLTYNSRTVVLKIWDTAGQERYRNITQQYYKNADAVLLMFDLSNHKSFDTINYWMNQILDLESIPILLVGTKADLTERQVSNEEAEEVAEKLKLRYFETSALTSKNISEVFEHLCKRLFQTKSSLEQGKTDQKATITIDLKKQRKEKEEKAREEKRKRCCN